jgi:hypothetical protein
VGPSNISGATAIEAGEAAPSLTLPRWGRGPSTHCLRRGCIYSSPRRGEVGGGGVSRNWC